MPSELDGKLDRMREAVTGPGGKIQLGGSGSLVGHGVTIFLTDGAQFTSNGNEHIELSPPEAEPYAGKLLPLPRFVREGGTASWADIADGLDLTGHFLMRDLLTQKSAVLGEARARLVDRLRRAGGLD